MEEQLEDAGVLDAIGPGHLYPTVRAAVEACESRAVKTHVGPS